MKGKYRNKSWHCRTLPLLVIVVILSQSILVVTSQQQPSSSPPEMTRIDNIVESVEASDKARIEAEQLTEEQARKHAQNVARLAATDQLNSEIVTNRTRAYLSCESGEMIVKIQFNEPFRGVGYSDYDRSSPCKFYGDGGTYYEMRLPLKGCGTKQEAPRIFLNNIILRFHRSLELEEDEIKTIICRYPPPLAPPPPLIAAPILEQPPIAAPFMPAHLSDVELILIVSALLFLTLLLLGIGMGYYCLKRRNIKVVRKFPPPLPPIPRASLSSSETYYEESDYDDTYRTDQHFAEDEMAQTRQAVIVPPIPQIGTHLVDDRYVTNASGTDIDEDVEIGRWIMPKAPKITALITDQYYVTPTSTTEVIDEITTQRIFAPPEKRLISKRIEDRFVTPQDYTDFEEEIVQQRAYGPPIPPSKHTEDDYFRDVYETDEIVDDTVAERRYRGPSQPTTRTVQTSDDEFQHVTHHRDVDELVVDDIVRRAPPITRKPTITVKNIEDFYVTNISETETTEKVIKTGLSMPNLLLSVKQEEIEEEEEERKRETKVHTGFDITMRTVPPRQRPPDTTVRSHTIDETYTRESVKCERILRVLDSPPPDRVPQLDDLFPPPKREKLRTIIVSDETFRTLIIESSTVEEYTERIVRHPTYGPMFEPPTWQVIFRLLSLPEVIDRLPPERSGPSKPPGSMRSYFSALSAHEARSVTEEDVNFSRRFTSAHFVPPPDYPTDDHAPSPHWASALPDPSRYDIPPRDYSPIMPAFATASRRRTRPHAPDYHPDNLSGSSIFGPRRLASPYNAYTAASPSIRRRLLEYGDRPYSPDIDALSLEPSTTWRTHQASSYMQQQQQLTSSRLRQREQQLRASDEREEIKSTTETDIYDWKRYS